MTIYFEKISRKLNAIKEKDLNEIYNRDPQTYIHGLGYSYTLSQLSAYFSKLIDFIENKMFKYTEADIDKYIDNVYDSLNSTDKAIADQILNGENFVFYPQLNDYDKLVQIFLYYFATTP
jgi:hypothetical protein